MESANSVRGLIFDIQRFSLNDGPGIRTLVFMKGCPLHCEWCSNPESQSPRPEIMFYEDKCIRCEACIQVCPHRETLKETWPFAGDVCLGCGRCVAACYAEARQLAGRWVTVAETLETIIKDRVFYEVSGGGVTIGGGEPTFQPEFVSALLRRCKGDGIHTAIETCGQASWRVLQEILVHTDLLLIDLKHMDPVKHLEKTGTTNEKILENVRLAAKHAKEMILRLPLIPCFNSDPENLHRLGRFARDELPQVRKLDILPYHSTGESKSIRLGRSYPLQGTRSISEEEVRAAARILESYGLDVTIGG